MRNTVRSQHAVVIAGAGPTGLTLGGELALAGVDVAIVERRPSQDLAGSRAGGLHSRTIEILDQRGIADRFLSEGQKAQVAMFAGTRLDISSFPTRHNYGLGLSQNHIERILARFRVFGCYMWLIWEKEKSPCLLRMHSRASP
jgi:2-polyprenyl-6-methoxyphenol hydroxylase-like FAD-dependent oxidoreductase